MTEPIAQDQAGKDSNRSGKLVRTALAVFPVLLLSANCVIYYGMLQQQVWIRGDSSWHTDTFELGHRWRVPVASSAYLTAAVVTIALVNTTCLILFISRGKPFRPWLPGFIIATVSAILSMMLFS